MAFRLGNLLRLISIRLLTPIISPVYVDIYVVF